MVTPLPRFVVILVDLLDIEKTLCPEFTSTRIPPSSLLAPVSKDGRKLALASVLIRIAWQIVFIAEGWELGDCFQEVIIAVDGVRMRKARVPLLSREDCLDSLHVSHLQVVIDGPVQTERGSEHTLHVGVL